MIGECAKRDYGRIVSADSRWYGLQPRLQSLGLLDQYGSHIYDSQTDSVTQSANTKPGNPGLLGWCRHARRWRARLRFVVAVLVFLVVLGLLLGLGMATVKAVLLAFDAGALVFLIAVVWLFEHADAGRVRKWAHDEEGGRWGFLCTNVVIALMVLVALGLELHSLLAGGVWALVLAAATLLLSWLFMNTMFALHYAYGYYRARGGESAALDFPGGQQPDYWDFAYFSVTIGMTFQVSDVQITDRRLRRLVMIHGVVAFFFNVIVIALTVNLLVGNH